MFLYAGLSNGILTRSTIDDITGKLADTRSRFLGLKPVKCFKTVVQGKPGLLALSSRPWLVYNYMDHYMTSLMSSACLDYAAQLSHPTCSHGFVGLSEQTKQTVMRILNIETFG